MEARALTNRSGDNSLVSESTRPKPPPEKCRLCDRKGGGTNARIDSERVKEKNRNTKEKQKTKKIKTI
jgi:hypothetical protein